MTGFEPRTSGIGSYCSTNWATTTAQDAIDLQLKLILESRIAKLYLFQRICITLYLGYPIFQT